MAAGICIREARSTEFQEQFRLRGENVVFMTALNIYSFDQEKWDDLFIGLCSSKNYIIDAYIFKKKFSIPTSEIWTFVLKRNAESRPACIPYSYLDGSVCAE